MKINKWIVLVVFGVIVWLLFRNSDDNDFRIGVINEKGLTMQSISSQRGMVNIFEVKGDVSVWIPKGLGWYRSDKVGKILEQEKKKELAGDMFFYNFGFVPEVIVYGDSNWWQNREVLAKWGAGNYLKFYLNKSRMMTKQEIVSDKLLEIEDKLGKIVQRDLADSRLLKEELRLTVYNLGQSNGMGAFMARVLEWGGFTVVGVDSVGQKIETECQINFGPETDGMYGGKLIKKQFSVCKIVADDLLGVGELEMYFGDSFGKMINYDSYKQNNQ